MKTHRNFWIFGLISLVIFVGVFINLSGEKTTTNLKDFDFVLKEKVINDNNKFITESDVKHTDPIVNPHTHYTYNQMIEDLQALDDNYQSLVSTEVIGQSVDGRDLYAARLGYGDTEYLIHAATHAREYMTTNVVMNQLDTYSRAFVQNEKIDGFSARELLKEVSIYYVPMVNPDGVTLVQEGAEALQNSEELLAMNNGDTDFSHWKANARGVDLNRNFSTGWEDAHADTGEPGFQNYKGPEPMSEPEVQALAGLIREHDFELALAYHSSGEIIYYGQLLPDELERESIELAQLMSEYTGYPIDTGGYGGMFSDWFVEETNRPNLTPEISPFVGPGPVPIENFDWIWEQHKSIGLLFAQELLK
ncbi:M14 family metallopeptidase [Aquisalibacillus elongatus]|uniref:G-D-glutamyl-meso-diaminopimelate peptidase n=1 Tax=Aquisalibacillus elongatus TaxID=485577 RepID=A0A3N5BWX9_9BACI|nr:M14 family metallocarboxypeptidase [Aquisalibacillus elongatus]RPF54258.1 g-D-glutamyl-meso-diaminopimelate peptidase [Aquisalibacillus elongatus]